MFCLLKMNLLDYYTCKLFTMESIVLSLRTRNSSGDEIANVNFVYDDIVHVAYYT